MCNFCLRIIDTFQFQRLQGMKQLGVCDRVFRGAVHTRFEHSMGVAYLAEKLAKQLRKTQPKLGITDTDVLCVKVAGLCHDLGHGPYSHLYDGVFIKRMYPNGKINGKKWRHEDGSVQMFNYLLKTNNIKLKKYNLTDEDKLFIEEIIGGVEEGKRKGRPKEKFFLYDIVNNTRSGLDVDKLDYFQRDAKMTNVFNIAFNSERFFKFAVVMPAQPLGNSSSRRSSGSSSSSSSSGTGEDELDLMICYPEKMVGEAVKMFSTRYDMHEHVYQVGGVWATHSRPIPSPRAYPHVCTSFLASPDLVFSSFLFQHKTVKAIEFMICDALVAADEVIRLPGTITEARPDGMYKVGWCFCAWNVDGGIAC